MKKHRLFSLILSALVLASCGSATADPNVTAETPETTTEAPETEPEYIYPDKDYEGHEFVFLNLDTCGWANRLCVPEETTGDLINDEMYERNARVGDRFNVTFSEITATKDELSKLIRTAVTAGDDVYDAAFCPVDNISALMSDGILTDLLKVSSLNLSEAWWDNDVIEAGAINDKCYLASSDITFFPFEATWILYFNEDRFDALNTPYPYDDVRSGKWTLDRFYELCQSGASLNGQDSYKYDENSVTADYGIVTHNQCVQSMMFGAGETLISTKDGKPVFSGESDRVYGVFEKIAKIFGTDGVCLDRDKIGAADTDAKPFARTAFRTGHFMFMSETLGHIAGLRDFDGNFGVLPLPKYDEKQESYHSMMASWGTLMTTIPASASDPERSGVILDALAFDSYKNLMEPYYDTYLNQKGARNEDSAEMLRIIRDTRIINVGRMFGWTESVLNSIASLVEKGDASVASAIAKAKPSIEKNIDKTLTAMAE